MNIAEQKIFTAFRKAASYISEKPEITPTDALVKSATEHDLNPEMTRRAGEMLNIFLTHRFMKSAADKTASFPTADLGDAIVKAFTDKEAPAAPAPSYRSSKKASSTSGSRFSLIGDRDIPQAPARDLVDLIEHLNGCVKIAADTASNARCEYERVRHKAFADYQSLVSHFQLQNNFHKFAKFEAQCLSEYGPDARHHLDLIASQLPGVSRLSADEFPKRALRFEAEKHNSLFDSFMDGLNKAATAQKSFDDAVLASLDMKSQAEDVMRQCCGMPKVASKCASDLLSSGVSKLQSSAQRYLPASLGGTGPGAESHDKAVGDAYGRSHAEHLEHKYRHPHQEADMEMDNIHRATILKDILANDEIVSAMDPQLVQGAYNGLLRLAPEATLNRAMVAGYLRQAGSQQALDPFTAKQIGDVTKVQLENKSLRDGASAKK